MNSKKYNNTKLTISIGKSIVGFLLIYLFVSLGYSLKLDLYLNKFIESDYLRFLIFTIILGAAGSFIFFPVNFYTGYLLEHKYNLSNQTLGKYFLENLKSLAVSSVIGLPILLLFYFALVQFGNDWWLPFAIFMFFISVILSQIFPIIILPIFYKIKPIENDSLKERIKSLAADAKIKVENVYSFDMSKNTKKANAAFTGLGKTKRIILGDTLLEQYDEDEIETVIAHELGHYKHNHIIKNVVIGTITSFVTLFVIAKLYENALPLFGFTTITQIAALPLLSLIATVVGLFQTPLGNIISRKFEFEADRYAIKTTLKPDSFKRTLEKLTDQNLGDKNPHPFVEWFFYSHPSIQNRISAIEKFSKQENISEEIIVDLGMDTK